MRVHGAAKHRKVEVATGRSAGGERMWRNPCRPHENGAKVCERRVNEPIEAGLAQLRRLGAAAALATVKLLDVRG